MRLNLYSSFLMNCLFERIQTNSPTPSNPNSRQFPRLQEPVHGVLPHAENVHGLGGGQHHWEAFLLIGIQGFFVFRRFFILKEKRRKTMLNTLLSVIRAILVELVDQLLRKVCTLG